MEQDSETMTEFRRRKDRENRARRPRRDDFQVDWTPIKWILLMPTGVLFGLCALLILVENIIKRM